MSQIQELKEAVRGAEDWVAAFMRQFGWPDRERAWLALRAASHALSHGTGVRASEVLTLESNHRRSGHGLPRGADLPDPPRGGGELRHSSPDGAEDHPPPDPLPSEPWRSVRCCPPR